MTESVAATTTLEEDRFTRSQRHLNLVWELTQAAIAVGIVGATIYAAFTPAIQADLLNNMCFLIVGFYFGRTNHARTGGTELVPADRRRWRRKAA